MSLDPTAAAAAAPAAGLVLMFALGARHGLEPDHMAVIDGMTLRAHDRGDAGAAHVGSWFALGHGAGVTLLALAIHGFSSGLSLSPAWLNAAEWVPIAMLYAVGALNLRALLLASLRAAPYQPASVRGWLMPAGLRSRSDAWAALGVGLLFALVFDVVTQVSAWSYSATQHGSTASVVIAGAVFSAGLVLTATLNSQLLCRMLKRRQSARSLQRYRRALGWFVVFLSFGMALFGTAENLGWLEQADAFDKLWLGLGSAALVGAVAGINIGLRRGSRRAAPGGPVEIET